MAKTRKSLEQRVDAVMAEYAASGAPGASVLVKRNGQILVGKSYGLARVATSEPATPATNYRLASVTKQFTAMAILILAEQGALKLDDPLTRWLPRLPDWGNGITILHLLTHTSGIADYEDLIPEDATRQVLDRDVLELVRKVDRTHFVPGSSYAYSNTGYALLALIVERASGEPFHQFLARRIFAPLLMNHSVAFVSGVNTVPNRAYGHSRTPAGWEETDQSITSAVLGDGGIYASIADLANWDVELESPVLIRPELLAQAFRPWTRTDEAGVSYGFGWRIKELDGRVVLYHTGETRGFRNVLLRVPDERLLVVILTNRNDGSPLVLAEQVVRSILKPASP